MKNIKILLPLLLVSLLFGCLQNKEDIVSIPELLDRPSQLADTEWDKVQNLYQQSKTKAENKPSDASSYIKLAEVFIHEARVTGEHGHYYPGAIAVLNEALSIEREPSDTRFNALLYKASVMLSQHDFEQAKELALEAAKINKYNAQLYGTLVDAYVELGDYAKAVEMGDKMVSLRPDLRSYSRISYLREVHGDMEGAIEAMTMAAESGYPGLEQTAWAKLTLGELHEENGDLNLASQIYKQILIERENYPFAIAALGRVELTNKNYKEAERLLLKAANIIPEVGYYVDLARLYKETNREEEFVKKSNEILEMLKDDVDSGHNMNLEYADFFLDIDENLAQAKSYALKEFEKRPQNLSVNKLMAKVCLKTGEFDKARKHIDFCLKINKSSKELKSMHQQLLASL
jgi:tetratricopeptide (TPR) repeat protein